MITESDMNFDENRYKIKSRSVLGQVEAPGMIKFLLKKGIVKSEKTAQTFLAMSAVTFLITSIIIFVIFVIGINPSNISTQDPELEARREAGKEKAVQMRNRKINNTPNVIQ